MTDENKNRTKYVKALIIGLMKTTVADCTIG